MWLKHGQSSDTGPKNLFIVQISYKTEIELLLLHHDENDHVWLDGVNSEKSEALVCPCLLYTALTANLSTFFRLLLWMLESEVTQSCPTLCNPMDNSLQRAPPSMGFLGKCTGVCCHFLLQGIFPTQGSNPGLPHCRQMLYGVSHWGSGCWRALLDISYVIPFLVGSLPSDVLHCRCLSLLSVFHLPLLPAPRDLGILSMTGLSENVTYTVP